MSASEGTKGNTGSAGLVQDILSVAGTVTGSATKMSDDKLKEQSADEFGASVDAIAKANGIATAMATSEYDRKLSKIRDLMAAKDPEDKRSLDMTLCYYFSVHGTSPDTRWSEYEHKIVFKSRTYEPTQVVSIIGQGALKKFCARYTAMALKMHASSAVFRAALQERAVRAGLTPGEEYLAIDFLGKDGTLDFATSGRKSQAKTLLLQHRGGNTVGVSESRHNTVAAENSSRPPVIPGGLTNTSFNRPA